VTPLHLSAALAALARRIAQDAADFDGAAARVASAPLRSLLLARAARCRFDAAALNELLATLPAPAPAPAPDAGPPPAGDEPLRRPPALDALGGCADGAIVDDCEAAERDTIAAHDRLLAMALPRPVRACVAPAAACARASHRVFLKLAALERERAV
jgi:hypothetical protein